MSICYLKIPKEVFVLFNYFNICLQLLMPVENDLQMAAVSHSLQNLSFRESSKLSRNILIPLVFPDWFYWEVNCCIQLKLNNRFNCKGMMGKQTVYFVLSSLKLYVSCLIGALFQPMTVLLFTAKSVPCTETWIHKRPWHGSKSRRCSSRATKRTGLTVIWHTVKDPRNLHSNCVPVGQAELSLSLAMLLLACILKLASALLTETEGGGGPVSEFTVASCHLSLSLIYSSIYTDMFTHKADWELSSPCVSKVLLVRQDLICLDFCSEI